VSGKPGTAHSIPIFTAAVKLVFEYTVPGFAGWTAGHVLQAGSLSEVASNIFRDDCLRCRHCFDRRKALSGRGFCDHLLPRCFRLGAGTLTLDVSVSLPAEKREGRGKKKREDDFIAIKRPTGPEAGAV
jgi:hypothetical protein